MSESAAQQPQVFGHPRGLMTLFFTEMWERLSYYGMRALLVLFMTDQVMDGGMGLDDRSATAIYGIYTALVYVVALPGGWIADRLLGAQRAVFFGGIIIMSGHFVLAIPSTQAFFIGLLLVIAGTGLLKPNVSAIVGELYPAGDPRRDGGFSIFYMGINVGAFFGPLICGTLGQSDNYGWHWGFAAAGVGMLFGLIQFWLTKHHLGNAGLHPDSSGDPTVDAERRRRGWIAVSVAVTAVVVFVAIAISGGVALDPLAISNQSTKFIVGMAVAFFAFVLIFGKLTGDEKKRTFALIILLMGCAQKFDPRYDKLLHRGFKAVDDLVASVGYLLTDRGRAVTGETPRAALGCALVVGASDNFLARITALVHADCVEQVEIQHMGRE